MKIFFIVILIGLTASVLFRDDHETLLERLKWNKNYTNLITGGSVDFQYSEEKGTHCLVKRDLDYKETTFTIPREFIICGCIYN
jgi:hypothetical protein